VFFKPSPRAFQLITFGVFVVTIFALVMVIWLGPRSGTASP